MVALPAATPPAIAEPVVAIEVLLLLQVPPAVAVGLDKLIVAPTHTLSAAMMEPPDGSGLIVMG